MNSEELLLLSAAAIACTVKLKRNKSVSKKNKKKWCKNWLLQRSKYSHVNLLNEFKVEIQDWYNYLRMDEDTYFQLLTLVSPLIEKRNTKMRDAINCHERLTATLRFLATGRSYADLKYSVIISPQALSYIIPDTCRAIFTVLKKEYFQFPTSEEEWKSIASVFEQRWNFPHCVGAIDGKHVEIIPPPGSGSYFYNYKGTHSMVLMAIADGNYEFIMCDFGVNGRISDAGVIETTKFYAALTNDKLKLPMEEKTSTSGEKLPYVFVGDEAFALRSNLLKPFSQRDLNNERRIFNYRLSRARRIIENAFGILAARFRIFRSAINLQLHNIDAVVMCCCVLHNFLRRKCSDTYISSSDLVEEPLHSFINLQNGHNRNTSEDAKSVREKFSRYFNAEGAVPWQNEVTKH